ncbi:Single-stranded DNA-binding protein [Nostocoides japonicum T1-X7]|uniref:Single-stranded DNA-binding protein n=1 Tax=Nostocoides japonicum T1-X7 TaxID=1194083 RepID=A0A077LV00_9MICO|nr:single-stranded DNA-binding protein [Tetrasphaera japonica]CCH77501.1 Single-stranded DNA-binding protein [Tetrasphaera japonica T1-X7]
MTNENTIVVVGNVVDTPTLRQTKTGDTFVSFRVASTSRRWSAEKGGYEDGHTNFYRVAAFRALAVNVHASLEKGQPVVVTGRLRITQFVRADGTSGTGVDIDATAVGHDLSRGRTRFTKLAGIVAVDDGDRMGDPAVLAAHAGDGYEAYGDDREYADLELDPDGLEDGSQGVEVVDPVTGEVVSRMRGSRDDGDGSRSLAAV